MATIVHTSSDAGNGAHAVSWVALGIGDAGEKVSFGGAPDRSVQVLGTFGGASLVIEGSNNGTDWFTLTDPQGGTLVFTAVGGKAITEFTRYIRPLVSGGDGTTDLKVFLAVRTSR